MFRQVKKLIKSANKLDQLGFFKEADQIDKKIEELLKTESKPFVRFKEEGVVTFPIKLELSNTFIAGPIPSDINGNIDYQIMPSVQIGRTRIYKPGMIKFKPVSWYRPEMVEIFASEINFEDLDQVTIEDGILNVDARIIYEAYNSEDEIEQYEQKVKGELLVSQEFVDRLREIINPELARPKKFEPKKQLEFKFPKKK